jgi:hypothetical protein
MLVFPSSSSLYAGTEGRRNDSTWPPDNPTARIGSVGWRACVKMSEDNGRVQRFSNISATDSLPNWCVLLDAVDGNVCIEFLTRREISPASLFMGQF